MAAVHRDQLELENKRPKKDKELKNLKSEESLLNEVAHSGLPLIATKRKEKNIVSDVHTQVCNSSA
jgi:hypothetical protein